MARCKSLDTNPQVLSVDRARQLLAGMFEHALNHLLDHEVDLAHFDARFRNDTTGAPAYRPLRCSKSCCSRTRRGLCAVGRSNASVRSM